MAEHDTQERQRARADRAEPLAGPIAMSDSNAYLWTGVMLSLLGALAILFPLISTLTVTLVVGLAILAAGLVKLWRAFSTRPAGRAVLKGFWGLLYLFAGALILAAPLTGAATLTIVLGALFIVGGVASVAWSLMPPRAPRWGWMLASGAVSMLLGVLLIFMMPVAAFWFPGLLAGVDLITTGAAFIAIDRAAAHARGHPANVRRQ